MVGNRSNEASSKFLIFASTAAEPGHALKPSCHILTTLSIASAAPTLPVAAALSSAHLAALLLPATVRRLYIAEDRDPAGRRATAHLSARALQLGCTPMSLLPRGKDFNEDLRCHGLVALRRSLAPQLHPDDRSRFLPPET